MKPTPSFSLPCALVCASLSFSVGAASRPGDASTVCQAPSAEVVRALIRATNRARSAARTCGTTRMAAAPRLRWSRQLVRAARAHSRDMARNNFFDHTGSDGLKSWDRAEKAGYDYRTVGENIAAGYRNAGQVQDGWLESPGHCENIMRPEFTQMGASCVRDPGADYGTYWTVVFGRPR